MIKSIEDGRKSDGNRSIADKILKKLNELRLESKDNLSRWLWELMQNSKDSIIEEEGNVSIKIVISNDQLSFEHDAGFFTELDIRGLINQITSKENTDETSRKRTGKFGTGFLTTNLLSKIVDISSVVKLESGKYHKFTTRLNRNGKKSSELVEHLEDAWSDFHKTAQEGEFIPASNEVFKTKFTYHFQNESQKDNAIDALDDINKLMPFVLVFNREFLSVDIDNRVTNENVSYRLIEDTGKLVINSKVNRMSSIAENSKSVNICSVSSGGVSIAVQVDKEDNFITLEGIPKIFCDYPLIGSENFSFPVVINSGEFNPLTERTGIYLSGEEEETIENKELMSEVTVLYDKMIADPYFYKYSNSYEIADSRIKENSNKFFDAEWFSVNIQNKVRDSIIKNCRVLNYNFDRIKLSDATIVSSKLGDKENEFVHQTMMTLGIDHLMDEKSNDSWREIYWNKLNESDFSSLCLDLQRIGNIAELNNLFDSPIESVNFLNNTFREISKNMSLPVLKKYRIFPDQNNDFRLLARLQNDKIGDDEFKDICLLLGIDIRGKLILDKVEFSGVGSSMTFGNISSSILKIIEGADSFSTSKKAIINSNLTVNSEEQATMVFTEGETVDIIRFNSRENTYSIKSKVNNVVYGLDMKWIEVLPTDLSTGIRKFCQWMEKNRDIANDNFKSLYRKKEKILVESIGDKVSLYKVMSSSVSLKKLAEVSDAIALDPGILDKIRKLKIEKEEEIQRNEIGERIERILKESLEEYGYDVSPKRYGRDLRIEVSHKSKEKIEIEVKYKADGKFFRLTSNQVKTALKYRDKYYVFTVKGKLKDIDNDYIKEYGKFINKISYKVENLKEEVNLMEEKISLFSDKKKGIRLDIDQPLEYKYRINKDNWGNTFNMDEFILMMNKNAQNT